jgi:hypothetical protein
MSPKGHFSARDRAIEDQASRKCPGDIFNEGPGCSVGLVAYLVKKVRVRSVETIGGKFNLDKISNVIKN